MRDRARNQINRLEWGNGEAERSCLSACSPSSHPRASSGTWSPRCAKPPPTAPTRTLLMIGDSLMGQHDVAFYDVLLDHGVDATVIDART